MAIVFNWAVESEVNDEKVNEGVKVSWDLDVRVVDHVLIDTNVDSKSDDPNLEEAFH